MNPNSNLKYPDGFDCIWLGSDKNGWAGAFVTAGCAPIPRIWLETKGEIALGGEEIIFDVDGFVSDIKPFSQANMLDPDLMNKNIYYELVIRGFHVYDWTDINSGKYILTHSYIVVGRPQSPLKVSNISGTIGRLAEDVVFHDLAFLETHSLKPEIWHNCVWPTHD